MKPNPMTLNLDALELALMREGVRQGDLTVLLHESQLEALTAYLAAPGSRYVLEVARRWGKTFLLLVVALVACLAKPKVRVVYGAPTLKHLAEFVLPTFDAICEFFPEAQCPKWNSAKSHIECPNGSYVHLFGADDKRKANRGRGPEAVLAVFDEAGFCPLLRYVLKSIFRPSLMHSGGRTIIASTPAEEPDHDFTSMAERAEALGAYFNRTVWDNPRLTKRQIEKFIEEDATDDGISVETYVASDDFRREYLAERVINRLLLGVPEWVSPWKDGKPYRESHVVEIPRPALFRGHTVVDFGGNDPHAYQLAYWHLEYGLVVERDRLLKNDERSKLLADEVKKGEKECWGTELWDGTLQALRSENLETYFGVDDRTGKPRVPDWLRPKVDAAAPAQPYLRLTDVHPELSHHLFSVGLACVPVRKTDKQYMVQQLRNLIAEGKYWLHPSCKDTDRHLRTTTWKNEKRKEWARRGGEHGDLVDDSVYLACGMSRSVPVEEHAVQPRPPSKPELATALFGSSRLAKLVQQGGRRVTRRH